MSRASEAGNSVVKAVETACAIYRVPVFRMQSRVFTVVAPKARGGFRPMAVGAWRDADGNTHTSGMADLLLQPCITIMDGISMVRATVPLWVECKAGAGRLTDEQVKFCLMVRHAGAYWIEARDSADAVLEWFKKMGVTRC